MGQSIAILIGNTKYDELSILECCSNDVAQIRRLLSATQKFSQIIDFINCSASEVKDKIGDLPDEIGSVDEIFVYFTGHGYSNNDDFYMCFREFKEDSPNTTGLSRGELLAKIRQFDSGLAVFVVDACEAGRNLIKSDVEPLVRPLKLGVSNYIQISSCTERQFSLAGERLSVFTDAFIKASLQKADGPVYYSDIESGLRDLFLDHPSQTPHFIRQGTSQERFCSDARRLNSFRDEFFEGDTKDETSTLAITELSAAKAAILGVEARIPDQGGAQVFIDKIIEEVINRRDIPDGLFDFFEIRTVKHDEFDYIQNKKAIIDLLSRHKATDAFVESDVERTQRRDSFGSSAILELTMGSSVRYDEKYKLHNQCKLKSVHVGIYFEPKYMALNRIFSEIVFLPRLTECLILTCSSVERRSGWGTFSEFEGTKKWKWSRHEWFDHPSEVVKNSIEDPYQFARGYVVSFGR